MEHSFYSSSLGFAVGFFRSSDLQHRDFPDVKCWDGRSTTLVGPKAELIRSKTLRTMLIVKYCRRRDTTVSRRKNKTLSPTIISITLSALGEPMKSYKLLALLLQIYFPHVAHLRKLRNAVLVFHPTAQQLLLISPLRKCREQYYSSAHLPPRSTTRTLHAQSSSRLCRRLSIGV